MQIRLANKNDHPTLAKLNYLLIKDEGHRNQMTMQDLKERVEQWLSTEYVAAVFLFNGEISGYTIWRNTGSYIYIRQFFIVKDYRGKGYAKSAFTFLKQKYWQGCILRLDVLVTNHHGFNFWRTLGFSDYCITMENNKN